MKRIILALLLVVLTAPAVLSFAVGSPYFNGNPVRLEPGQSTTFGLTLQNLIEGDGDIVALASVEEGGDIASIADQKGEYDVPKGSANTKVNVYVRVPEDATPGEKRTVVVGVAQKPSEGGGAPVRFRTSYRVKIPVEVISLEPIVEAPAPVKPPVSVGTIVTVVAMLLLLMLFVLKLLYHKDG